LRLQRFSPSHRIASHRIASHRIASHRNLGSYTASPTWDPDCAHLPPQTARDARKLGHWASYIRYTFRQRDW